MLQPTSQRPVNLITVKDRWGNSVRINQHDLDNNLHRALPIYNRNGKKIIDSASYNYKRDAGIAHIIRENIQGTPEYQASQEAVKALYKQWENEEAETPQTEREIVTAAVAANNSAAKHPTQPAQLELF